MKTYNPINLKDVPLLGRYTKLRKILEKLTGLAFMSEHYGKMPASDSPAMFVRQVFDILNISFRVVRGIGSIPKQGPLVVAVNHPTGVVEGMILIEMISKIRPDVKVMTNGFLERLPELRDAFISVNPYNTENAKKENTGSMRKAVNWVKQGGVLVVFPAGDVSEFQLKHMQILDGPWEKKFVRIAELAAADLLPVHIEGKNSVWFYLASMIHPVLKTIMLPSQFLGQSKKSFRVFVGNRIPVKQLAKYGSPQEKAQYLKMINYMLKDREAAETGNNESIVVFPENRQILASEVEKLGQENLLVGGELEVYVTTMKDSPQILHEIGRLREYTFRTVGEGTGNEIDLDLYDNFYYHLFIWDKAEKKIAGSYRIGAVGEIMEKYGREGLYTHSLFYLKKDFIKKLSPALELGRSFIRPEYQKNFSSLLLLWRGISEYVYRNKEIRFLFGPVSISNSYTTTSRDLMIHFLKDMTVDKKLEKLVWARNPYKVKNEYTKHVNITSVGLDELSSLISRIEGDEKGIPVLVKQYLKLGAKMLRFNVDEKFGDCIDGLIYLDMLAGKNSQLSRYMGKEKYEEYLAYHAAALKNTK